MSHISVAFSVAFRRLVWVLVTKASRQVRLLGGLGVVADYCRWKCGSSIDLSWKWGWILKAFSRSRTRRPFGDGRASIAPSSVRLVRKRGLGSEGFATRWIQAELEQLIWSSGLRMKDELLMVLILGSCWIWEKLLMDKKLHSVLGRGPVKVLHASLLDETQWLTWSVVLGSYWIWGDVRRKKQCHVWSRCAFSKLQASRVLHASWFCD